MAITTKRTRFSRRLPDHVTDELVNVLSEKKVFGFNDLFERVFANLKLRNAVSGGEEMLRLRAYEKLQNLVTRGLVEKIGKLVERQRQLEKAVEELEKREAEAFISAFQQSIRSGLLADQGDQVNRINRITCPKRILSWR